MKRSNIWLVGFFSVTVALLGCGERQKCDAYPDELPSNNDASASTETEPIASKNSNTAKEASLQGSVEQSTTKKDESNPESDAFIKDYESRLAQAKEALQTLLEVKDTRNIDNTFIPYHKMSVSFDNLSGDVGLFQAVHPNTIIRDYCMKAEQELSEFITKNIALNRNLYDALAAKSLSDEIHAEGAETSNGAGLVYAYDKTIENYKLNGIDRDEATRTKVASLFSQIDKVTQEFSKNVTEDVRKIVFKLKDLAGLPDDFIKSKKLINNDSIELTTNGPDIMPVLTYAENAETRRKLYAARNGRGYPQNQESFKNMLMLRHELSNLLSYKNWADYNAANEMAKDSKTISSFLQKTYKTIESGSKKDYQMLLEEKKKEVPNASALNSWDLAYYERKAMKNHISFDSEKIREYLPFNQVKQGVFAVSEKLYGVKIIPLAGAKRWHPSVTSYELRDAANNWLIGYFDLDMFPRENKYTHAAQFSYRSGYTGLQLPHAVLVCNFAEPNEAKKEPGLLEHSDVETFFHEFGHLLHALFRGHNNWDGGLEHDFVEVPSQFFEEWAYDEESLALFAKHYKTNELLKPDMIEKLQKTRTFNIGINTLTQYYYATLSLNFHNENPLNINFKDYAKNLWNSFQLTPFVAERENFIYSFDHLTGYSSGYYTYLWSLVIAKDFYTSFKKSQSGLFSKELANDFRKKVLAASGTSSANDMIKNFLGRQYEHTAFKSYLEGL